MFVPNQGITKQLNSKIFIQIYYFTSKIINNFSINLQNQVFTTCLFLILVKDSLHFTYKQVQVLLDLFICWFLNFLHLNGAPNDDSHGDFLGNPGIPHLPQKINGQNFMVRAMLSYNFLPIKSNRTQSKSSVYRNAKDGTKCAPCYKANLIKPPLCFKKNCFFAWTHMQQLPNGTEQVTDPILEMATLSRGLRF
eukprot:TRINITY_DN7815_c0_g1_i8.p1 TRINITY_DN7815_c0_g1~~TRINITY_DN7815_c0_g1_i8.p1  ORF type:complete len:194 (+),score=-3.56 TRINITY_DN7815_c0_g1_i8:231-812(+)